MSRRSQRTTVGVTFLLALLLQAPSSARPQMVTEGGVELLEQWTRAVMEHTPGQEDGAVAIVRAWSFDQRTELNPAMLMFLDVLTLTRPSLERKTAAGPPRPSDRVRSLARATFRSVGVAGFLQRAAVLHGDAAMAAARESLRTPASTSNTARTYPAPRPGTTPRSPLLFRGLSITDSDGELRGQSPRDWNWPFARSLLDPDLFERADITWPRAFVSQWYHATAAFLFRNGLYSELPMHLESAAAMLGDDPFVLFDRACLAEVHGLPILQNVLTERDIINLRRLEARRLERGGAVPNVLGIPLLETTNGEAERLFRQTISADSSIVAARVRLARLLLLRGRDSEALDESEAALRANPERTLRFYAHMMAGRAARRLGRDASAASHFAEAIALFPDAQSALLAASHLAITRADLEGALSALDALSKVDEEAPFDRDPWWSYRWCAGRDADALLAAMWAGVPQAR